MRFVIYTPKYTEDCGGTIVLHKLAGVLNSLGVNAEIWPMQKPVVGDLLSGAGRKKWLVWFSFILKQLRYKQYIRSPYNLKVASCSSLKDAIVIYPEVVSGNPLQAKKVVRWLLNKPGAITGEIEFGDDEVFFYYNEHFKDSTYNKNISHHLNVVEPKADVYVNFNKYKRIGQCYMVRKGKGRSLSSHDNNAVLIDGMSHLEAAKQFNRCKYFVCYDLYTMYARYAAMCGCIPVVIPKDGLSKEEWRPEVFNRYGIAYGWDDIGWAVETRKDLLKLIQSSESRSVESVKKFISTLKGYGWS